LGVAGQIFGADKKPVSGLTLRVSGTLNGKSVSLTTRSGIATYYGPGGYEIKLADTPVISTNTLYIEVIDTQAGTSSDRIYFNTYTGCEKNQVLVNFTSTAPYITATPVSVTLQPSRTSTVTRTPLKTTTKTPTLRATRTPLVTPSKSPTKAPWFYSIQSGNPKYVQNFAHPETGCRWMGVAGLIFDDRSHPVYNVVVEVGGTLNGKKISVLAMTGFAPAYGPGGYEIKLSDQLITSNRTLYLVVYDLNGIQLSEKVYFNTYNDCTRSLVLVNYIQTGPMPSPIPVTPITATYTPTATITFTPTLTPMPTVTPTPTIYVPVRYNPKSDSPSYSWNLYHPEAACRWMGIGGQVFDANGKPVKKLVIEVGGQLAGREVFALVLTGLNPVYGSGGYEVLLSSIPITTQDQLWIMVHDLEGNNLSDHIYFNTDEDCNRNLILMNFEQSH
jgi:protocatechuate 3,4-dioxygenase beta subunit